MTMRWHVPKEQQNPEKDVSDFLSIFSTYIRKSFMDEAEIWYSANV